MFVSLHIPSRVGDQFPASFEASDNLNKLLHADCKEKVATRVALEHFNRIQTLKPGYLDGVKSWAKSGLIYLGAGTVTVGAIGLTGYGLWQAISKTDYGPWVVMGLCGTGWISSEAGYRPIEYVKGLLAMAVRDSANRAANSSVKNDERVWKSNESKIEDCHNKILEQLLLVYDDCAKELSQQYQQADKGENINERLALKQMVCRLEKQLPRIEKLLGQFQLEKNEVETVLQKFKDRIGFVQNRVCSLSPNKTRAKLNADLIARWSPREMREIAVPFSIRERALDAHKRQFTFLDRSKGYLSAAASGVGTLIASTALTVALAAALNVYQTGNVTAPMYAAQNLYSYGGNNITPKTALAALGVLGLSTTVAAKRGLDHYHEVQSNAQSTEEDLKACTNEMQGIYDGVAAHLKELPLHERSSLANALSIRLSAIRNEIEKLRIVQDPKEIIGPLEQALNT